MSGTYTDASGNRQGLLLTGLGSSWSAVKAPLPLGAAANPSAGLDAIACPSASQCVAVGSYDDTSGNEQVMLLTGSGSSWTATKAPVPANGNTANPELDINAVACSSPSLCTVVGDYLVQSGNIIAGLLLTGAGTSWTATQAPLPGNAVPNGSSTLNGIACQSTTACTAVGVYKGSPKDSGQEGLLLTGSGSSWTPSEAPLPGNADIDPEASLGSVSCISAGPCLAIGPYTNPSGNTRPMLVSETGSSWSAIPAPLPANTGVSPRGYQLAGVRCTKKNLTCIAVGLYPNQAGDYQAALLTGPA